MDESHKKYFIINWRKSGRDLPEVLKEMDGNYGFRPSCIVSYENPLEASGAADDCLFFNLRDARLGVAPGGRFARMPNRRLISQMQIYEPQIFDMICREFYYPSIEEYKLIYYRVLGFWNQVIDEINASFALFNTTPHVAYEFILYQLCKLKGIKTIIISNTFKMNRVFLREGIEDGLSIRPHAGGMMDFDYMEFLRIYKDNSWRNVNALSGRAGRSKRYLWETFSRIKSLELNKFLVEFGRLIYYFNHRRVLLKEMRDNITRLPPTCRYIYFPLHKQPEKSTVPTGRAYSDQLLALATLVRSLPSDMVVCVKEHPLQWSYVRRSDINSALNFRPIGFYNEIVESGRVRLLTIDFPSAELLRGATAVATIAGTAGFEGLLSEKPVFLFGDQWYKNLPGVFIVRSANDVKNAFKAIQFDSDIGKLSENDCLGILESTFDGYFEMSPKGGVVDSDRKTITKLCFEIATRVSHLPNKSCR